MKMNRHCRQQEQKGQSTVEYAGAAFVVVAIIATIATLKLLSVKFPQRFIL